MSPFDPLRWRLAGRLAAHITKLSRRKNVASRLRFMLQDVVALRSNAWSSVRKEVADGDEEQQEPQQQQPPQQSVSDGRMSSPMRWG